MEPVGYLLLAYPARLHVVNPVDYFADGGGELVAVAPEEDAGQGGRRPLVTPDPRVVLDEAEEEGCCLGVNVGLPVRGGLSGACQ